MMQERFDRTQVETTGSLIGDPLHRTPSSAHFVLGSEAESRLARLGVEDLLPLIPVCVPGLSCSCPNTC